VTARRLCLPCLSPSRSVRFTNRFTEQVVDLRVSSVGDYGYDAPGSPPSLR
jgi:hypothetical protein